VSSPLLGSDGGVWVCGWLTGSLPLCLCPPRAGQLGRHPRGRQISAGRQSELMGTEPEPGTGGGVAERLAELDPQNSPKGIRNEDMIKLQDRLSGWV
jgi:hypothetical protein